MCHTDAVSVNITPLDPILPLDPYRAFLHNQSGVNSRDPGIARHARRRRDRFRNGPGPNQSAARHGSPDLDVCPDRRACDREPWGPDCHTGFSGALPVYAAARVRGRNYQLSFTVPPDMPRGPQTVAVRSITGNHRHCRSVPQAFSNLPTITGVTNGANFSATGPYSAGSFVSIFGAGFGAQDNLSAFRPHRSTGYNGFVQRRTRANLCTDRLDGQLNTVLPAEVPANGSVTVVVQNLNGPSRTFSIKVAAVSPGIFIWPIHLIPPAGMQPHSSRIQLGS